MVNMRNIPEEQQAVAILFANGIAEMAHKVTLNDGLMVAQILVAVSTALWFFRKAKGVKLDNKRKEEKLKK